MVFKWLNNNLGIGILKDNLIVTNKSKNGFVVYKQTQSFYKTNQKLDK
jgi:hypothetical protein